MRKKIVLFATLLIFSASCITRTEYIPQTDNRKKALVIAAYDGDQSFSKNFPKDQWNVKYIVHENLLRYLPGADYNDYCSFSAAGFENKILECADKIVKEMGRPDYILNLGEEKHVVIAAKLRDRYHVPTGIPEEVAQRFYDKLIMKRKIHEKGILTSAFVPLKEYKNFLPTAHFPLMIKIRTEAGSRSIFKVHNEEELKNKIKELEADTDKYLLEEYIDGDIYSFDGIIKDGQLLFEMPVAYHNPLINYYQDGKPMGAAMLPITSPFRTRLREFALNVTEAMNYKTGLFHMEIIRERSTDKIFFLEIAARYSGTIMYPELKQAMIVDIKEQMIRLATDQELLPMGSIKEEIFAVYEQPANQKKVVSVGLIKNVSIKNIYKRIEPKVGEKFGREAVAYFRCDCSEKEMRDTFSKLDRYYKIVTEE